MEWLLQGIQRVGSDFHEKKELFLLQGNAPAQTALIT